MRDRMFAYWVRFGIRMKWVSPIVCNTHVGTYEYESEENKAEWDEGLDPCVHVMLVLE